MSTLDRNGLVVLQDTDAVAPFHPLINGVTESVSQRFDNLKVPSYTSATRPSPAEAGQLIYETDTGRTLYWTGSSWEVVAPRTYLSSGYVQWPTRVPEGGVTSTWQRFGTFKLNSATWTQILRWNIGVRQNIGTTATYSIIACVFSNGSSGFTSSSPTDNTVLGSIQNRVVLGGRAVPDAGILSGAIQMGAGSEWYIKLMAQRTSGTAASTSNPQFISEW